MKSELVAELRFLCDRQAHVAKELREQIDRELARVAPQVGGAPVELLQVDLLGHAVLNVQVPVPELLNWLARQPDKQAFRMTQLKACSTDVILEELAKRYFGEPITRVVGGVEIILRTHIGDGG